MGVASTYEIVINAAIRFVSFRPRSEKELRQFLEKKLKKSDTYAPLVVVQAVDRMRELGYVDDYVFATWWATQRQLHRPKGRSLVIAEIVAHGVSKEVALAAYDSLGQTRDEVVAQASSVIEKKWKIWHKLPALEQKKKIYEFLGRRGFGSDVIASVVDSQVKKR